MKFTSFIFICGWYLVLTLFSSSEFISLDSQLIVAGIFIFSVGIPHGAIDHIIFFEENRAVSTFQFYFFYFSLMAGYVLAWLVLPLWSFIFFSFSFCLSFWTIPVLRYSKCIKNEFMGF